MLVQRRNRLITPRQRGIVTPRATSPAGGLYTEFPGDEIVDVHFKSKEPPDEGGGGDLGPTYTCGVWHNDTENGLTVTISQHFQRHGEESIYRGPTSRDDGGDPCLGDVVWQTGSAMYLTGSGLFFNPYKRPDLDPPGWTMFVVPVVGYSLAADFGADAVPVPYSPVPLTPCGAMGNFGVGFSVRNKVTEGPDFTLLGWETNAPESPNFGMGSDKNWIGTSAEDNTGRPLDPSANASVSNYYDVTALGEGVLWQRYTFQFNQWCQFLASFGLCGPAGCWLNQFIGHSSLTITAICREPAHG